jgi:hypothetical protein
MNFVVYCVIFLHICITKRVSKVLYWVWVFSIKSPFILLIPLQNRSPLFYVFCTLRVNDFCQVSFLRSWRLEREGVPRKINKASGGAHGTVHIPICVMGSHQVVTRPLCLVANTLMPSSWPKTIYIRAGISEFPRMRTRTEKPWNIDGPPKIGGETLRESTSVAPPTPPTPSL